MIKILHAQTNKTRFFYALFSEKKNMAFDQSESTRGPIYIIK